MIRKKYLDNIDGYICDYTMPHPYKLPEHLLYEGLRRYLGNEFATYNILVNKFCSTDSKLIRPKEINMNEEIEQEELFVRCRKCGELITDENRSELANDICKECKDYFVKCDDCGEIVSINDIRTTEDDRYICQNCVEANYFYCDNCGELHHNDECFHIEDTDEDICGRCYDGGGYTCCSECGNYISFDGANYEDGDEDRDNPFCEECFRKISPIMNYGTKVEDIDDIEMFQKTKGDRNDTKLFYGIELEVLADNLHESPKHTLDLLSRKNIILKRDGSLSSNGYEIVTAPMTFNRHHEFWRKFFEEERNGKHYAKGLSSFNTDCCGMHVHISRDSLQLSDICKIVFFINEETNIPFVTFIASRNANSYCAIKKKSLEDLQAIQKNGRLRYNDRYEAVNLENYNTIEIRIFRGTVEQVSFFKNLEFVDCLIKFVRNKTFLQLSYDEFLKFLAKYKERYPNLYKWIIDKDNIYSNMLKRESK